MSGGEGVDGTSANGAAFPDEGGEFDPNTMSAKQFARWALDSKKPAPFVQALYDLVSAIS